MSLGLSFPICQMEMLCYNVSVIGNRTERARGVLSALLNIGRFSADPPAQAAWHQRPILTTGTYCFPDRMFLLKGRAYSLGPKPPNQKANEMLVTEEPPETKCPCEVVSERLDVGLSGKDKKREGPAILITDKREFEVKSTQLNDTGTLNPLYLWVLPSIAFLFC